MPVKFHPNNPIDALETIIVKEDGSPLRGKIDIYRQLWNDLLFPLVEVSSNNVLSSNFYQI
jgi:hypothetical protein